MAILEMKRIEILAMLANSKKIVDLLQEYGVVEIDDHQEESSDILYKVSVSPAISQIERFHASAESAIEILNNYAPVKSSMLASFAPRKDMTVSEFLEKSQDVDKILDRCSKLNGVYKKIQDKRIEIVRCNTLIEGLAPWLELDIPSSFKGTASTSAFIGRLPDAYDRESLISAIVSAEPELGFDVEIISSDKIQTCIIAICHKDGEKDFEQALRRLGFITVSDPNSALPGERMDQLQKDIEKCNDDIAEYESEINSFAQEREQIEFLLDYLMIRIDKYKILDKLSMSKNIFIVSGYIPATEVDGLEEKLEARFDVAISVTDPDFENEDVPVALSNGRVASTMEFVTNMYSTPGHDDIDPNPFMPFAYFNLFGLMLGDAGYGLLMVIVTLFVKLKIKPEPDKMRSVDYGLYCGIFTVIWGALMNGWFGDLPQYLGITFITDNHWYWFQPLDHTTRFLLFCFFLGLLHLGFGVVVNMIGKFKKGKILDGILDNVPVLMIIVGVLPLINSQIGGTALAETVQTLFIYDFLTGPAGRVLYMCLAAGAILVVLTQGRDSKGIIGKLGGGLWAIYNAASGYLGDILSYSRLLALGLCTGVIASVINQLASMPGNPIIFAVVCVFGHAVNLGINLIGTYVHTNRLQYVEFFSKFYEGGGRLFQPLKANSKTFKFKEEAKS
ncbi:MAG: V-type ATP synthase subunit I [Oscillospiraceae bacterium]|jgi:V/A-type H+-transporting ATPase subunit I|nr:V-type ATP synthase subunit I [Oscillospiraceae bacterium]